MNQRRAGNFAFFAMICGGIGFAAQPAHAASLSLTRQSRLVTSEEIAGGAHLGGLVHDFFLTSDSDLLSFSNILVDSPLYQHAQGSDWAPPAASASAFPGLSADSFITTPGSTIVLGGGFAPTGNDTLWGDLSNDGPQSNFHFARLTNHQTGTFSGRVAVRGYDSPVYMPFNFSLPATEAGLGTLAGEAPLSMTYSLDPPPPAPVLPPAPQPPVSFPTPGPALPGQPPQAGAADPPAPGGGASLASIELTRRSRAVTGFEAAAGASLGGMVHEFFVSSTTDLLSVGEVAINSPLFQSPLGVDHRAPDPALVSAYADLGADSFITMPGETMMLGGGFGSAGAAWGDLSNNGVQSEFMFARLTVDQTGVFAGQISAGSDAGVVDLPFNFLLPGSMSDMGLLANEQTFRIDVTQAPPQISPPVVETPDHGTIVDLPATETPRPDDPSPGGVPYEPALPKPERPILLPFEPTIPNDGTPSDPNLTKPLVFTIFPFWELNPGDLIDWNGAFLPGRAVALDIDVLAEPGGIRTWVLTNGIATTMMYDAPTDGLLPQSGVVTEFSVLADDADHAVIPEPAAAVLAGLAVAALSAATRHGRRR